MSTYLDVFRSVQRGCSDYRDVAIDLFADSDAVKEAVELLRDAGILHFIHVLSGGGTRIEVAKGVTEEKVAELAAKAGLDLGRVVPDRTG